jgi:hypothetical protein
MNLNTLKESPIILMEQPSEHSNWLLENLEPTVSQLEPMMRPQIQLPISPTGETESNQILMPSVEQSQLKSVTSSASLSSNLKSNVKPHALLEKPPEVRLLKVSKEDIKALCQVITEFQEQFIGY